MNKIVLSIGLGGLCLLIILFLQPIKMDSKTIIPNNTLHNNYLKEIGLEESDFLNEEKRIIYEEELIYLNSFKERNYIIPNDNPFYYSRNWASWNLLEYNKKSEMNIEAYLFNDNAENYFLFINFAYKNTKDMESDDYLEILFSKHYQLYEPKTYAYYEYQEQEYKVDVSSSYIREGNKIAIPSLQFFQYFKKPIVKGFIYCQLEKDEDYESDFFECVINVYDFILPDGDEIILGFNSFRSNLDKKYIPRSFQITYFKENE